MSATTGEKADVIITPQARDRDPSGWQRRRKRNARLLALGVPALVLVAWQVFSNTGLLDTRTFSSPTEVMQAAVSMTASGELITHVGATLTRVGVGYVVGAALGVLVGLLIGWSDVARMAGRPTLSALYTIPKLGVYPLLLLVFGLGDTPKIVLVGLSTFLIVVLATIDAVGQVPTSYMEAAVSLGAPRRTLFVEVIVPASLTRIFTSLRLGIGYAILVVIGTEMVSSNDGIGYLLWSGWNLFRAEQMFVAIVLSSLLGVTATLAISALERLLTPWHQDGQRVTA